ncbi:MAG: hypothetical protein Edafosvirus25_8 [Edafosvirus sp.]|uniref:Uncharacterized protein n=1 Tax=Edafosvirus sp. TaxID=2487765 RepID=A0A3G4ZWG0_9VIRU|nr:MAG: hypothetical protein Edafosvirus25_8 [Edafosvirus sp.]
MNIGHSSRLIYDNCAYEDRLEESTSPLLYQLNPNKIYNCNSCLSTLGPRPNNNTGVGVSTAVGFPVATSQALVDVESVLSNRNLPMNKCKAGEVNPIDVTKFQLRHARICNDFLNPLSSRLSYPAYNYRDIATDRFYNLPKNPQVNIFWDYATNTKLEAKDNFVFRIPNVKVYDGALPIEVRGPPAKCAVKCVGNC